MSLLTHNSTPAERARGCTFAETFESAQAVVQNGGTILGDPVVNFGAVCDDTLDAFEYPGGQIFGTPVTSIVVEFTPSFYRLDGLNHFFIDTSNAVGRYYIYKGTLGQLAVAYGGTVIISPSPAQVASAWIEYGRNVLVVSAINGAIYLYLNGVFLRTEATAWTPTDPPILYVGEAFNGGNIFDGTLHSLKIFNQALTAQEALDYYNDTTYTYENECSLHLPMGAAQHDPTNVRTLDVSGNNRHAIFGDGSTPATYPTKIARHHGYDFDAGDYLTIPGAGIFNGTGATIAAEFEPSFTPGVLGNQYRLYDSSDTQFLVYFPAASGDMWVYMGGTVVVAIAFATYAPYWREGARNLLIVSGVTGATNVRLNGTLIGSDNTAWTNGEATTLYIAANNAGTPYFTGAYNSFRVWRKALTPLQIHDLTIRTLGKVNDV